MKVVLVCTGAASSPYLPMTGVVAAAARHFEPTCVPVVLTDAASDLDRGILKALEDVATVVPVEVPHDDAVVASRWLKVHLRSLVDGPFLFLDSDALPVAPFLTEATRAGSFAAVPDSTGLKRPGAFPDWARGLYQRLGWAAPSGPYMNSGVTFWRDDDVARAIGRSWEDAWETTRLAGEHRDQPSLNHAIDCVGYQGDPLGPSLNTMVEVEPHRISRARVLHFFVGVPGRPEETLIDHLARARLRGLPLDFALVGSCRDAGTAWVGLTSRGGRDVVAQRAIAAAWRLLNDRQIDDALWVAHHAVRVAPWRVDTYTMVVRVLAARVRL